VREHLSRPEPSGITLVLSSGGARGLAHVGVLQVLGEAGIPVARVIGVSAGALFGAMFCAGLPIESITDFSMGLGRLVRRQGGLWDYLDPPDVGLIKGALTRDLFDDVLGGRRFDQLATPLSIVATDLCHSTRIVLEHGSVADAVRASIGIVGVYAPWPLGGHLLCDGGLVDPVPTQLAGPRARVIAVDVSGAGDDMLPDDDRRSVSAAMSGILARARALHTASRGAARPAAAVTISPAVEDFDVISYSSAADLIARGREASLAALPAIQRVLA
jgi:NTE family protein